MPNSCSNITYFYFMSEKSVYIIYLRVIATVFVILIHASTGFLYRFNPSGFDWNYANWINAATRCSVPIFVMLSGALLINKDEGVLSFYKKRLPKLLFPFAFWTLIYLLYYFFKYSNFEKLSIDQILEISMDKILHGSNAHLWYLYMIIGLYLVLPYFGKMLRQLTMRELEVFLLLWICSMFLTHKRLYDFVPKFDLISFSGYAGYLVLGYYLSIKQFNWTKITPWIGYVACVIFTACASYALSNYRHKYDPGFLNYVIPNTVLVAFFLFIAVKKSIRSDHKVPGWIALIDKYSFGIYLSHIIPLNYIHPILAKHVSTLWVIPLATLLTLAASILITLVIRSLPAGKYVSG